VPHRLLLADDSVTIQRVIELTFADEDVKVVAVGDGDQAIARLNAEPPDIVLADIGMPGKSGYEVAAFVKRTPRLAHIPVVLLTGASEAVDPARMDGIKCDGVLAKPFEPQLVIGRVKELLSRRDRQASAADAASDRPAKVPQAGSQNAAELDGYFDRLDAAFANISGGPVSSVPSLDLPLSYASPRSQFEAAAPVAAPPAAPAAAPVVVPAAAPGPAKPALPPLADAFAAILAAEQTSRDSAAAQWPATVSVGATITEDLIDQVSRRVLERLSDRIVRETVAGIVAGVAERVVRDEIEKLKNGAAKK
jgi:CheY-like chemotaxis protein